MERIPVAGPWITAHEIGYVQDAATRCWYDNANEYVHRFERAMAGYLNVPHAVALPSCTSAIHLALLALGVETGDEVVVPDATWIATSAPISYVGATPVFADIDPVSWCLCARSLERSITPRTRAVFAVDLYGGMPDMHALLTVPDLAGRPLIEDPAEAHGSEYRRRKAGSSGTFRTFSFHGSKTLTTGEGGMLLADDEALYQRCLFLRDHGRPPGDRFFHNT